MRVNILEDTVLNMKLKYKYLYLNQFKVGNLFKTGIKGTIGGILIIMTTAISMANCIIVT